MARKKKFDFSNIGNDRKKTGTNQKDFWTRYGVGSEAQWNGKSS